MDCRKKRCSTRCHQKQLKSNGASVAGENYYSFGKVLETLAPEGTNMNSHAHVIICGNKGLLAIIHLDSKVF